MTYSIIYNSQHHMHLNLIAIMSANKSKAETHRLINNDEV